MSVSLIQLEALRLQAESLTELGIAMSHQAESIRRQVAGMLAGGGWHGPEDNPTGTPEKHVAPPADGASFLNQYNPQEAAREQGERKGRTGHRRRASG